jgi:hypothetical protein
MIKYNLDIIILIILLIFNYLKYIKLNNYIILITILFIEFLDTNYIEKYYPTSINNTQILQNIRSVFNEKKTTFKNLIIDGDFISHGMTDCSGHLDLSQSTNPNVSDLLSFSNGWKIGFFYTGGTRHLTIKNSNNTFENNTVNASKVYSSKNEIVSMDRSDIYKIKTLREFNKKKTDADKKWPIDNPSVTGNVKMNKKVLALDAKGETLYGFNPFRNNNGTTSWFYGCGIEFYRTGNSGTWWSMW